MCDLHAMTPVICVYVTHTLRMWRELNTRHCVSDEPYKRSRAQAACCPFNFLTSTWLLLMKKKHFSNGSVVSCCYHGNWKMNKCICVFLSLHDASYEDQVMIADMPGVTKVTWETWPIWERPGWVTGKRFLCVQSQCIKNVHIHSLLVMWHYVQADRIWTNLICFHSGAEGGYRDETGRPTVPSQAGPLLRHSASLLDVSPAQNLSVTQWHSQTQGRNFIEMRRPVEISSKSKMAPCLGKSF